MKNGMDAMVDYGGIRSSFVLRWKDPNSANISKVLYVSKRLYQVLCRMRQAYFVVRFAPLDRQARDPIRQVDFAISG